MPPSRVLTEQDQEKLLVDLIALAKRAGEVMKTGSAQMFAEPDNFLKKATAVDLVTQWDVKVEKLIQNDLEASWPGFQFIGEESYTGQSITDEPTFCIDPIGAPPPAL